MTRTLTAAAIMLAAITTAPAIAEPLDIRLPAPTTAPAADEVNPPSLYGWAAVATYHTSCGQTVPAPIIKWGFAYANSRAKGEYNNQLGIVWAQRQELGREAFCAALQASFEPLFPEMLVKATEAGFGGVFGARDVEKILATYKANELRFDRDYIGRSLELAWPFKLIMKSSPKRVEFGTGLWSGNVQCLLSNDSELNTAIEFNRGQWVHVKGTISGTSWTGDLELKNCTMTPAEMAESAAR